MKIKISDLKISPRIRKEAGNIEELAASMARLGQMQPIVVDDELNLIAGGRRVAAACALSWSDIEAISLGQLDATQRKDMELEENIKRKDLEWPEEVRAVRDIYVLRNAKLGRDNPTVGRPGVLQNDIYSMDDMASDFERSKAGVSTDIALAKALDEFPEIGQEPTKNSAWKRFKRLKETQIRSEQARRTTLEPIAPSGTLNDGENPVPRPGEIGTTRQPIAKVGWKGHGLLYHADCRDVMRLMRPGSVDCIVTDPPFGLGMFKADGANANRLENSAGAGYDDDPYEIMNMLDEAFMHAAKALKPDGHAYVFFHMTRYEETYRMLRKHFGQCEETPIIWLKNTTGIGNANVEWVYGYEPFFFINRGRQLAKPQGFNYIAYNTIPPNQKIHPTEKPASLLRHIVQASALPGEVVFDPFAGSGSTLVAACQVGCRFIGIERSEIFHRAATERISEAIGSLDQEAPPREELVGK